MLLKQTFLIASHQFEINPHLLLRTQNEIIKIKSNEDINDHGIVDAHADDEEKEMLL